MKYRWVRFRSIVERIVGEDRLFSGKFIIDPYQKCDMGCIYCDAAEDTVFIKSNAMDLIERELDGVDGLIVLGSACDPYQRIEKKIGLTRKIISKLIEKGKPFHLLTKSDLVLRDKDLISSYDGASVTISISTLDERISKFLEPFAPPPLKRVEVVRKLRLEGINAGIAIMPFIPNLTDKEVEEILKITAASGANYIIYEYLELKGTCRDKFFEFLRKHLPACVDKYEKLYMESYNPVGYDVKERIKKACTKYNLRMGFVDE